MGATLRTGNPRAALVACNRVTEIDVLVLRKSAPLIAEAGDTVEAAPDACAAESRETEAEAGACIDSSLYPGGGIFKADFSDVPDMTLNQGASTLAGGAIRLVSTTGIEMGSAYFTMPVPSTPPLRSTRASPCASGEARAARVPTEWRSSCRAQPMGRPRSASPAVASATARQAQRRHRVRYVLQPRLRIPNGKSRCAHCQWRRAHPHRFGHADLRSERWEIDCECLAVDYDATQKLWRSACRTSRPSQALRCSATPASISRPPWARRFTSDFRRRRLLEETMHDLLGEAWFVTSRATEVPLVGCPLLLVDSKTKNARWPTALPHYDLLVRLGCFGKCRSGPSILRRNRNRSGQCCERRDRPR